MSCSGITDDINRDGSHQGCCRTWEVHKFGGTSVASADCYRRVASIIEEQISACSRQLAVVVSAMGAQKPGIKVTDLLLSTVRHAADRDKPKLEQTLQSILNKHYGCIAELSLPPKEQSRLKDVIQGDVADIKDILKTVSLMKWQAVKISELVSGYGELWSAQILASLLQQRADDAGDLSEHGDSSVGDDDEAVRHNRFVYLDARRVITVDEENATAGSTVGGGSAGGAGICWDLSQSKLNNVMEEEQSKLQRLPSAGDGCAPPLLHLVITGYVASNTQNVATTLQRDGSDYSAAIMGRLLHATSISIWTDVDGVLSADPRRVPGAHVLPEVSYNEAMELAYFGAKVIHPKTMQPAISQQIPIYIRNTFNSSFPGTRIYTSSTTHTERDKCVCGFTSIDEMALINVEGSGLIGVHGVAKRLFATLESIGVNVVLISQASSEHSITFATQAVHAADAKVAIKETFDKELRQNHISAVDVTAPCSIIAAVGDGMSSTSGVAGLFFSALGDARINIMAISQGCSERNISAVVMTDQSSRALQAAHAAFRLSHTTVRIGVVMGIDELGYSLLHLLESQRGRLRETFEIDLQVVAVLKNGGDREENGQLVILDNDSDKNSGGGGSSSPASSRANLGTYSITTRAYDQAITGGGMGPLGASETESSNEGSRFATVLADGDGGNDALLDHVVSNDCAHAVIFDCTADQTVASYHPQWLEAGVHVVTANSTGLSGPRPVRNALDRAEGKAGKMSAKYLREVAAPGGALPVLGTLRDLLNSGDQIRRIDGIMSISMSYIMHRIAPPPGVSDCGVFDETISRGAYRESFSVSPEKKNVGVGVGGCTFSEAVKEAISLGLMETDPLKDLSNECTARCLIVLAKELGIADVYDVEKIQMASDMLVVDVAEKSGSGSGDGGGGAAVKKRSMIDVDVYDDKISAQLDKQMKERVAQAAQSGCVPRHVSSIDMRSGEIEVKVIDVPCTHMFAINPPGCEIVRFFTHRHKRYPLIVQGLAEGADSKSSALLAELLNLMRTKIGMKSGALSRTESSAYLA